MSAGVISRGLSAGDLAKLYIRFTRVVRLLGIDEQVAYKARRQDRFPLRTIRELNIIWCYSAEVDAHMRGHHEGCLHTERAAQTKELPQAMKVPREDPSTARNIEMVRLYRKGKSASAIGRQFGISRQRVDQILARFEIEPLDEGDDEPEELIQ